MIRHPLAFFDARARIRHASGGECGGGGGSGDKERPLHHNTSSTTTVTTTPTTFTSTTTTWIVCEPSSHDSLLLRGVAKGTPRHERRLVYNFTGEGIPESDHLTSLLAKGGLLVLDNQIAEGSEDKELLDLFTKHSHRFILVPRHVSTRKVR